MENEQRIITKIEMDLSKIIGRLEGKTQEEQQKIIHDEREKLMAHVRKLIMLATVVTTVGGGTAIGALFGPLGVLGGAAIGLVVGGVTGFLARDILIQTLGFDPFAWLCFKEYNYNAQFAKRDSSDPHLFNALKKAGNILEDAQSSHLKTKSYHFRDEVTSTTDVNRVADSIIAFCKVLATGYKVGISSILLDTNDVKLMLAEVIKKILESARREEQLNETWSSPIIMEGCFAWVKYDFSSTGSLESGCCSKKKICDVDVSIKYYCFPSEGDFRAALRDVEREIEKQRHGGK